MKKNNIKLIAIVSALTIAMTGCGTSKAEEKAAAQGSNNVVYGIVTEVTEDSLTVTVGEVSEMDMSNMPQRGDNASSGDATGEMPSGEAPSGEAPSDEMPSGEAPSGEAPSGEMPSGEKPTGEKPSGNNDDKDSTDFKGNFGDRTMYQFTESEDTKTITIDSESVVVTGTDDSSENAEVSDIQTGDVVEITLDSESNADEILIRSDVMNGNMRGNKNGNMNGNMKGDNAENGVPGSGEESASSEETNGDAANTIDKAAELTDKAYASTGEDENALRIEGGAKVNLSDIIINKSGDSSNSENSDFYGMNAGILARDASTLTLSGAKVTTDAKGANGVFCYGEGTTLNISDSTITTSKDNSGGIETAGGGTTNATNLTVSTKGQSSAAIRSDRGGGTVSVTEGTYETSGIGSPAIYSTADVTVKDAKLISNSSEAVVVEGMNSVVLNNCEVTGNMAENGDDEISNVMIYQSMSGDANEGTGSFTMTDGSMTALAGDMFYVTNTDCEISLSNVTFTNAEGYFLRVSGNTNSRGWGSEGSNGGDCTFTASKQTFEGEIYVDDISTLTMTLSVGTNYTGKINTSGEEGEVTVTLDSDSTWTLTGDSYISKFSGDMGNVNLNGHKLYVDGEEMK